MEAAHDDYSAILARALADRLAEALAEYVHQQVKKNLLGYETGDAGTTEDLIREKVPGIRPAPGYPACPDHTEKRTLLDWLNATEHTSIRLTETWPCTRQPVCAAGISRIRKAGISPLAGSVMTSWKTWEKNRCRQHRCATGWASGNWQAGQKDSCN